MADDLISRQQAIDALDNYCNEKCEIRDYNWCPDCQYENFKKLLMALPSAQPDTTIHDSIPSKKGRNDGNETSGDCIGRQQAIDALKELTANGTNKGMVFGEDAVHRIEMLPSVQPERKKGRWIPTASGRGRHECSRCHEYAPCYQDGSEHLSTFCVLCGAKMKGGYQE